MTHTEDRGRGCEPRKADGLLDSGPQPFWHQGPVSWKIGGQQEAELRGASLLAGVLTGRRPVLVCGPGGWGPLL